MLQDNHGNSLAFGLIIGAAFVVGAGVLYALFLTPWNVAFIPVFNGMISNGMPSQQTADSFGFYRNASVAVPIFTLIGLLLWAWIRGLEARN